MTTANAVAPSAVYFYQQRGYVRHIKRFKKQADQLPHSLRNLLNPKANLFKRGKPGEDGESTQTLTSRLAELALFADESLDSYPPGTANSSRRHGTRGHPSATGEPSTRSTTAVNPYTYTDTRLNAMKQLTEGLLAELQEYLTRFEDAQMRPVLSGTIIYELHADWSDLTDNCSYETFPLWRTKHGRDLLSKSGNRKQVDDDATSTTSSTGLESRSNSTLGVAPNTASSLNRPIVSGTSKKLTDKSHRTTYVPPRLDPITEEKNVKKSNSTEPEISTVTTNRSEQTQHRTALIHFSGVTEPRTTRTTTFQFNRKLSILKSIPSSGQTTTQSQTLDVSRITTNSSNSAGWAVTFNLADAMFEEKGWTIITERIDQQPIDFQRRALRCLSKSLNSIEETRIRMERFGLVKLCKIRFYGDHKREQIEKYKSSNLKPKKSNFAMAILRREIPRLLEYETIIETIYTLPFAPLSSLGSVSSLSQANMNDALSTVSTIGPNRVLCSTHTNDGTIIVYYPSGQIGITCANVFGYFVEGSTNTSINTTMNTANMNSNQLSTSLTGANQQANNSIVNQQNSINNSGNNLNQVNTTNQSSANNTSANNISTNPANLSINSQNFKDCYTTIIYDDVKPRGDNATHSATTTSRTTIKSAHSVEGRLMALITSTGYCVCYRRNGNPRFICNEFTGILCNEKGLATYQWRWDDMKLYDTERIKDELTVQLNDYISIEYQNPYSIILKFDCKKEVFEFNLGINKDNIQKVHELLQKTASDVPMQSKAASHKIQKFLSKGQSLHGLKTAQYQPPHLYTSRKPSAQITKEDSKVIVERLLDNSITYKDVPLMKDLLVIQKKIRGIFDEWLQYCRNTLGVLEPNMYILPEFPNSRNFNEHHAFYNKITIIKRKSKSAEIKKQMNNILPELQQPKKILYERSKSAYIARPGKSRYQKDLVDRINEFKKEMSSFRVGEIYGTPRRINKSRNNKQHSLLVAPLTEEQKMLRLTRSRTYINNDLSASEEQCPVTLRYKLLFDRKVDCKCKRHIVPVISDVEFDKFLRVAPQDQLIVIAVINSNEPSVSHIENSFEHLYESSNRNRVRPCIQSLKDEYRFFYYDVLTATNNSNHYQPLLIQRHNVIPGMVLMYENAKLIFCDHIFNGYGYDLNDFIKQLHQSKLDAKAGKFLPYNFRFNRPRGLHGQRSAWGGEIGGLLLFDTNTNLNSKHLTNSLDSFTKRDTINKKRPFTQGSQSTAISLHKENTTIPVRHSNANYVNLPKIKQQASIEA